jgi:hypothetical protein
MIHKTPHRNQRSRNTNSTNKPKVNSVAAEG